MVTAKASITAEIMAIHRATEMLRSPRERVCQDPFAVHFLSQAAVNGFGKRERTEITRH